MIEVSRYIDERIGVFFTKKSVDEKVCTSGCCTPQSKSKAICPKCNKNAKSILAKTVEHLLTEAAKEKLTSFEEFYFCKTPSCQVIYFRDDEMLMQNDMRVTVGIKDGALPATTCYCFGWTKEKIRAQLQEHRKTNALEDIKQKMKQPGCSCELLNPSGRCCLADNAEVIHTLQKELHIS